MACILWMSDVFFANFSPFLVWVDGETHVCFHAFQLFQLGSDGQNFNFCWLRYASNAHSVADLPPIPQDFLVGFKCMRPRKNGEAPQVSDFHQQGLRFMLRMVPDHQDEGFCHHFLIKSLWNLIWTTALTVG